MPVHFKLVGYTSNDNNNCIVKQCHFINLELINSIMKTYEISDEEFSQIKFITDSETIKGDKVYSVTLDNERIIHIFTSNSEIREKLKDIFRVNGEVVPKKANKLNSLSLGNLPTVSSNLVLTEPEPKYLDEKYRQSLIRGDIEEEEEEEEEDILTEDDITELNSNIIRTFGDDDFKTLFKIYHTKPELFSMLYSFISSGDIVENVESKTYSEEEEYQYQDAFIALKNLELGFQDDEMKSTLDHFKGHLNLTLRYLLCKNTLLEES